MCLVINQNFKRVACFILIITKVMWNVTVFFRHIRCCLPSSWISFWVVEMLHLSHQRFSFFIPAQSFLNYILLCLIFTTWLACRRTEEGTILTVFKKRGWKYFLLALVDVEANYLIVKAYHFTTVTSVQVGVY